MLPTFADIVNITMFDPHSPQAQSVLDLFTVSSVILAIILVLVVGMVGYISQRFRARPGETGEPPQVYGNTPMEITWTLVPLGIVILLTVLMARCMLDTHTEPSADQVPDVTVIGHQWWWEVKYPNGVITANEVHVPVGKHSYVKLDSADVIHDFWVPQLGPKQDMLPEGKNQFIYLEPRQAGVYRGVCAEFCGNEHAWMRIYVQADEPDVFQAWLQHEAVAFQAPTGTASPTLEPSASPASSDSPSATLSPSASPAESDAARQGAEVFASRTCVNCHRGPGMASGPNFGPDLTWVGDRHTLGAGAVENNSPEALADWLRDPQAKKSQCNMPNFHLTESDIQALVAYLWRKSE